MLLGFFFSFFFSGKSVIIYILKGILPFKMHKIVFFPRNLNSRFHQLIKVGWGYPKHM